MNYQRIYNQLMERGKHRALDCYSEWHHILPRSLGGGDENSNLVELTYREHFLAHWLLTKIYNEGRGRRAMIYAFQCMGTMGVGDRMIASWQYEVAKRVCADGWEAIRIARLPYKERNKIANKKEQFSKRKARQQIAKQQEEFARSVRIAEWEAKAFGHKLHS